MDGLKLNQWLEITVKSPPSHNFTGTHWQI